MEQFNNVDKIHAIINEIVNSFGEVIEKHEPHHHKDPYSYFLDGHCTTFVKILDDIFDGNLEIYSNQYHVIVKIGDNFYDVRGMIPRETISDYQYIDHEYFIYIEEIGSLGNNDKTAINIIPDLVEIGKNKYNEVFLQSEQQMKLKKTIDE